MLTDLWPLLALRVTTPRLELRLPDERQLAALAEVAAAGIHPADRAPFLRPWATDPRERARSVVQYHWLRRGNWRAAEWMLPLAVLADGEVVGQQSLYASDFGVLRCVQTTSWLGMAHQGRGIGTEMRAAVLHLAFAGLGASEAVTGAFSDNPASLAVSTKLGYRPDGVQRDVLHGAPVTTQRLRLSRADWAAGATTPVTLTGLSPCLRHFGL
ncbi:GNAT family N-acetyltransferase [Kitasatospora azatica]|uniref:GNAT family N-acetyltransferase n=1 Tax=Kitasatospora azatica TaxID=58347 RepID=UPI00056BFC0E|nr:GNAT family protein [Kitasatospora azatica]